MAANGWRALKQVIIKCPDENRHFYWEEGNCWLDPDNRIILQARDGQLPKAGLHDYIPGYWVAKNDEYYVRSPRGLQIFTVSIVQVPMPTE